MNFLKAFLLAVLLFSTPYLTQAQEVTYSQYDKFDYRDDEYAVVGMTGGYLYCYRSSITDGSMLDAYDDSMNKVATVILDFFPGRIYETHFIAYPDKILVLYQALVSNKVIQYAALLDEKGRLKGKPIELGNVKTGILGATKTYFSYAISDNKKNILIYRINDHKGEIELDARWLDDNATVVKKSKATFKSDNDIEHGEVNIANDGTVYVAAYTADGMQHYADQYWILSLPIGANKFSPVELPLQERYAANGYMKIDNPNNQIYFGGFYTLSKNGDYEGVIYAIYDINTHSFQTVKFLPLGADLYHAAGFRHKSQNFNYFQVRQIIVKNDGGFVLVTESQYVTSRSNIAPGFGYYSFYSPYMNTVVHEYHFNDIMALSYNKDGVREWGSFIPKNQYSQEDGGAFSSYSLLNTGGTLAFLFNDFNPNHSRIQLATLTDDGKTETHPFSPEGNDYPDWLPKSGKQVAGRILIVPCFHKKQICFAKVVF